MCPTRPKPPCTTTCLATSLDFAWANPSTARAQVQGGKMKVLGIAGTRRVSTMPKVPTFAEQGFQGFDMDSWIGIYAPARLPTPTSRTAWVTALREITAMPDVSGRLTGFGFEPLGNTPAQFMQSATRPTTRAWPS
jgi:tripartite-type tricarboxylate transporter receptor subunit TctC